MPPLQGWYAQRRSLRTRQIVIDLVVACWVIICAVLGVVTTRTVGALAAPLRSTRDQAQKLADYAHEAAEQSRQIPALGEGLSKPFDSANGSMLDAATAIDRQIVLVGHVALLLGWLVFAIPVVLVLLIWLPIRLRFRRRAVAAHRMLEAGADLDLFAMRALATQPLPVLADLGDDLVEGWRRGDAQAIHALASAELRHSGLEPPAPSS
jgi:hypothetical protein